jgi:hypothetical protein
VTKKSQQKLIDALIQTVCDELRYPVATAMQSDEKWAAVVHFVNTDLQDLGKNFRIK